MWWDLDKNIVRALEQDIVHQLANNIYSPGFSYVMNAQWQVGKNKRRLSH